MQNKSVPTQSHKCVNQQVNILLKDKVRRVNYLLSTLHPNSPSNSVNRVRHYASGDTYDHSGRERRRLLKEIGVER